MRSASRRTGTTRPFIRADGDADVVIVLQHHLVALDLGVDPRELAQRADRRLDEERRDAEADAVLSLNVCLWRSRSAMTAVMSTSLNVVEHRGRALRLDEAPRDRGAALRHADALLGAISLRPPPIFADGSAGFLGLCWRGAASAPTRRPATGAACGAASRPSTSRLMTRPASPLPRTCLRSTSFCCARLRAAGVARVAFLAARSAGGRRSAFGVVAPPPGRAAPWRAVLDHADDVADLHVRAVSLGDLPQHAPLRRRDLEIDLVGLELDEGVADVDGVPFLSATSRPARRRWTRRLRARGCLTTYECEANAAEER